MHNSRPALAAEKFQSSTATAPLLAFFFWKQKKREKEEWKRRRGKGTMGNIFGRKKKNGDEERGRMASNVRVVRARRISLGRMREREREKRKL